MNYIVPVEIAEKNRRFYIAASTTHFDPRTLVIHSVCELEFLCAQILYQFFAKQGCAKTWEDAETELFGDNGLLSSLTRMTRIASYLNLVSEDEIADLRILARLRNRYAHGRDRNEFNNDEVASKLVRSLVLFKNSPSIAEHNTQAVFMCCYKVLADRLAKRLEGQHGAA